MGEQENLNEGNGEARTRVDDEETSQRALKSHTTEKN